MTHREMANALRAGTARPRSSVLTEFVAYAGHWWLLSPDGWLRMNDPQLRAALSQPNRWIES